MWRTFYCRYLSAISVARGVHWHPSRGFQASPSERRQPEALKAVQQTSPRRVKSKGILTILRKFRFLSHPRSQGWGLLQQGSCNFGRKHAVAPWVQLRRQKHRRRCKRKTGVKYGGTIDIQRWRVSKQAPVEDKGYLQVPTSCAEASCQCFADWPMGTTGSPTLRFSVVRGIQPPHPETWPPPGGRNEMEEMRLLPS